jgi:hypothetical protein
MKKKSTLVKFVEGMFVVALLATVATVEAQQVRYKMTTDIPVSITTPDSVATRLGTLKFFDGFPDAETVKKVYDNLDFQRGVQAFLTALPAASAYAFRMGLRTYGPDNKTMLITESPARKPTGYKPFQAKDGGFACGSTARWNPGSTRAGGPGKSSRSSDLYC